MDGVVRPTDRDPRRSVRPGRRADRAGECVARELVALGPPGPGPVDEVLLPQRVVAAADEDVDPVTVGEGRRAAADHTAERGPRGPAVRGAPPVPGGVVLQPDRDERAGGDGRRRGPAVDLLVAGRTDRRPATCLVPRPHPAVGAAAEQVPAVRSGERHRHRVGQRAAERRPVAPLVVAVSPLVGNVVGAADEEVDAATGTGERGGLAEDLAVLRSAERDPAAPLAAHHRPLLQASGRVPREDRRVLVVPPDQRRARGRGAAQVGAGDGGLAAQLQERGAVRGHGHGVRTGGACRGRHGPADRGSRCRP